ncbi:MAG: ribonuclease HI [Parcubacteria group bacterium Gr01-1014_72]|nr:MAG: ribonuclease HI [Parcubacteria group bacterium Gr01-1014_72]
MISDSIIIFTDGSSRGNPGPGGWAAVVVGKFKVGSLEVIELGGREEHTTNNRMELTAAIKGISVASEMFQVSSFMFQVFTDSSYLVNGITKWVHGWQERGWKTAAKKEVENRDLWERLLAMADGEKIKWKLIAGHAGVTGNVRCDDIATAFADGKKPTLYRGSLSAYPIKNILNVSVNSLLEERKKSARTRSAAKAYSYVSALGGTVEIHKTWEECERRVKGKSGARYKKTVNAEEEARLISKWGRQ